MQASFCILKKGSSLSLATYVDFETYPIHSARVEIICEDYMYVRFTQLKKNRNSVLPEEQVENNDGIGAVNTNCGISAGSEYMTTAKFYAVFTGNNAN